MIKRYCDRCGQQIDEGVHAWYVLELHGTDGEFRHKELCEECYAYLCEKDEVPMPQTDDKCIGCKLCYEGICYCPEDCEACDRNEPTPQEYEKWLFKEPKVEDEPQTEMTTEQVVNELLSIKKILDDGKLPKQRCGNCKHLTYRWNKTWCDIKCDNPHDMVCDKWERSE